MSRGGPVALAFAALAGCEVREQVEPWDGGAVFPSGRPAVTLPAGPVGFVTNSYSDTLSLLDLGAPPALPTLATVAVGRDPVAVDGPHHVAIDRRRGYVYLALSYPQDAVTLGPHAAHASARRPGFLQVLRLGDFTPVFEAPVDENPGDIVRSADGSTIAVSHFALTQALDSKLPAAARLGRVHFFSADAIGAVARGERPASSVDGTKVSACRAPHGVALSADGGRAWVACYGEDAIVVVDRAAGAVIDRLPLGPATDVPAIGPYALVASPDGGAFAVGTTDSRELRVVEGSPLRERFPARPLPGAVYFPGWSADGARLYAPTQNPDTLQVVDGVTGALKGGRSLDGVCVRPHEARVDGATVLVVCEGDHQGPGAIVRLDGGTLTELARTAVGSYPDRLAVEGP